MQTLREQYRPTQLSLLFVGESAPAGKTFFYAANSGLFTYTRQAFATVFGPGVGTGEHFLRCFRSAGCYLEDLCLQPVNRLSGAPRRALHREGIAPLASRLSKWSHPPHAAIVVGLSISRPVATAIVEAGWGEVPVFPLASPSMSHHVRYVPELVKVLETAVREAWIVPPAI